MTQSCLSGEIAGDTLRDNIPERWNIDVRRRDGTLALIIDCLQARQLAKRGMVVGFYSRKGIFRYCIAMASKQDIVRVLRMDAPRHAGDITPAKASDMQWPIRYDRAKGGMLGGFQRMQVNQYQRARLEVPGLSGEYERRIVA